MADALTVNPALMQGYMRAANKISREALGDPKAAPAMAMYRVPRSSTRCATSRARRFGTRGGTAVVHQFPADGDYTFRLALYYDYLETLFGADLPGRCRASRSRSRSTARASRSSPSTRRFPRPRRC